MNRKSEQLSSWKDAYWLVGSYFKNCAERVSTLMMSLNFCADLKSFYNTSMEQVCMVTIQLDTQGACVCVKARADVKFILEVVERKS